MRRVGTSEIERRNRAEIVFFFDRVRNRNDQGLRECFTKNAAPKAHVRMTTGD